MEDKGGGGKEKEKEEKRKKERKERKKRKKKEKKKKKEKNSKLDKRAHSLGVIVKEGAFHIKIPQIGIHQSLFT